MPSYLMKAGDLAVVVLPCDWHSPPLERGQVVQVVNVAFLSRRSMGSEIIIEVIDRTKEWHAMPSNYFMTISEAVNIGLRTPEWIKREALAADFGDSYLTARRKYTSDI